MNNLFFMFKVMITMLIVLLFLPSCNNEDVFIEQRMKEVVEEETPDNEDETPLVNLENDEVITKKEIAAVLDLYKNDIDLPVFGTIISTEPSNGILSIDNNGTIENPSDDVLTYIPNDGFFGEDSFDYTVCDSSIADNCDTATVNIIVNNVEDGVVTELKAFPSAYGGGANATGGRGGSVYHVTSLDDNGIGSFRWATNQTRPATIVFDVSGTIELNDWLVISGKDLTIAGQTAPTGGITITTTNQSRFVFSNIENMIVRYVRIRMKDSPSVALHLWGQSTKCHDLIFDHCSISYGGLQAFAISGKNSYNITFQKGLIAESKTGALFGDTGGSQNHTNDPEIQSYNLSFLNNVFYNVSHRLPNTASNGRVDVINNVIQNWTYRLTRALGDIELNQINNYYAAGDRVSLFDGLTKRRLVNQLDSFYESHIYTAGNIIDKGLFTDVEADNRKLWMEFRGGESIDYAPLSEFVDVAHPLVGVSAPIKSAVEIYNEIVNNPDVGANASVNENGSVLRNMDENDSEYLEIIARGEGAFEAYSTGNSGSDRSFYFERRYLNFLNSITATPVNRRSNNYDTDGDGMPDAWEISGNRNLDPNTPDGALDRNGDGYTNLEEFLNKVDFN